MRRLTKKEKKKGNNHKSSKRELLTAPGLEGARGGKRKYWIPLVIRWEPPGEMQPQRFVGMARTAGGRRTEVRRNTTTLSYSLISCSIYQWPSPTRREIMEDTVYRGRDPTAHKHGAEVRIEKGMRMDTIQCT